MKTKILLFLLFLGGTLCAGTVDFRGGKVLCAELSLESPRIANFNADRHAELPADRIYGAMTVLCDEGRSLSVHDYGIECFGRVYPCVAVRSGNGDFIAFPDETGRINPGVKYTLLFMLDSKLVGLNQVEPLTLKALFPPEKYSRQKLEFRNLGKKTFTPPDDIPLSGLMTEKK